MPTKEEIFKRLSDGVVEFKDEAVRQAAQEVLEHRIDIVEAILKGLSEGMTRAGELFKQREYYVPEILMCADAMEEGMKILRPHLTAAERRETRGKVLLGTVEGDIHSIGKDLVRLMLDVNGFEVVDLGVDVPLKRFVEEQTRIRPDIVGLSALMTTTMMAMKKLIPMLKENAPDIPVMVGGAPLTDQVARMFGADGYAADAVAACELAASLMARKRA